MTSSDKIFKTIPLVPVLIAVAAGPMSAPEAGAQSNVYPPVGENAANREAWGGIPIISGARSGEVVVVEEPVVLTVEAQREVTRRMERVREARETMNSADKLRASKDYEAAIAEYQTALDILPEADKTRTLRNEITKKFADASVGLARQRAEDGRYDEAISLVEQVLAPSIDPENEGAQTLLKHLNDPGWFNPAMTPQHAARVDQVVEALEMAQGYYNLGDFDGAEKEYYKVLNIDRYNTGARRGLEENENAKIEYFESAYDETRARFLREVSEKWETPVPRIGLEGLLEDTRRSLATTEDGVAYISAKLKDIIIPTVSFRDASLEDAVSFLRQKSEELDDLETNPARKGVNIIIQNASVTGGGAAAPTAEGAPATAPIGGGVSPRITLNLTNVPLVEALRYVTELAGRKYKIDPFAVKIVPLSDVGEDLFTKVMRVPPNFLDVGGGAGGGGGGAVDDPFAPASDSGGGGTTLVARPTAKVVLEEKGISFPPGSSAFFNPATSQLVVRNTQDNMELIETFVDSLREDVQKQISILSKFVEITQDNLTELGFDWLLGAFSFGNDNYLGSGGTQGTTRSAGGAPPPPAVADFPITNPLTGTPAGTFPVTAGNRTGSLAVTSNSIDALIRAAGTVPVGPVAAPTPSLAPGIFSLAGIFTDPQFQLVIRAIDQKKGVDLLSAPSVTAKSGQRAKIEVIREFIYPTEYDPPEIPDRVGTDVTGIGIGGIVVPSTTFPVTPANPTAFETRNTGVTLEVDPVIGADGFTIDLNLVPEVVEFQGFINYGSPITAPNQAGTAITVVTANRILMPIFGTRKVTTAVTIWDGQTVAIGGLIREDVEKVEDKIPILGDAPLLGRFFRSNVDQRRKRNLTVFVTARLIDPAGQPIREDKKDDDFLPSSPPPPPPSRAVPAYGKRPIGSAALFPSR